MEEHANRIQLLIVNLNRPTLWFVLLARTINSQVSTDHYVVKVLNALIVTAKMDNAQVVLLYIMLTTILVSLTQFLTAKFKQLQINANHAIAA